MEKMKDSKGKQVTCYLLFCVSTAIIGSLQFGYNIGVINAPYEKVQKFFRNVTLERTGKPMEDSTVTTMWSVAVSIYSAGGMIGAVSVGALVNKFGGRKSMMLSNIVAVIGGVLMGLSTICMSYELLIVGRLVIGAYCGLATALTPMYLGELAPTALRGAFGTLSQLGIVIGIQVAQVLGLESLLGSQYLWPLLLALTALPAVLQCVMLIFCLESPRYLLISMNKEDEAREDVEDEIHEMKEEAKKMSMEKKVSIPDLFRNSAYRQPMIIAIMLQLSQQLSGINAVMNYSTEIFSSAGITNPIFATIGAGVINTLFTVISIFLVERAGRRTLHLIGLAGIAVSVLIVTISLRLVEIETATKLASLAQNTTATPETPEGTSPIKILAVLALLGIVASFAIGPGPIPWFIVAELFAQAPRPAAFAVSGCCNWAASCLVVQLFPLLSDQFGAFAFIIFLILLIIFFVFTYFRVPETKGRTFEDITSGFSNAPGPNAANYKSSDGAVSFHVSPSSEKMAEISRQEKS